MCVNSFVRVPAASVSEAFTSAAQQHAPWLHLGSIEFLTAVGTRWSTIQLPRVSLTLRVAPRFGAACRLAHATCDAESSGPRSDWNGVSPRCGACGMGKELGSGRLAHAGQPSASAAHEAAHSGYTARAATHW
jgi:hypothetical protein